MSKIITEITPLSDCDCFYLIDRQKDKFDYPLHQHNDSSSILWKTVRE